jgi:hypothetical protein
MSEPLYPTLTMLGGLEVVVNPKLVRAIEPNGADPKGHSIVSFSDTHKLYVEGAMHQVAISLGWDVA